MFHDNPIQVVLVSATVPPEIQKLMGQLLPGMRPLRTASLHRAIAGSRHQFVSVPPGGNKLAVCVQLVQGDVAKGRRVLVFCGTVDSARAVDHYFQVRRAALVLSTVCCFGP
jgi:superfamily II DNA/RNA helicase